MLICEPTELGVVGRTVNLVVVVVQADNVDAGESRDLSGGTTDTTPDIKNGHALSETHHVCEVVLMAGDSLVEALALVEAAEVERLAPTVLVEICREVVVTVQDHVLGTPLNLFRLCKKRAQN